MNSFILFHFLLTSNFFFNFYIFSTYFPFIIYSDSHLLQLPFWPFTGFKLLSVYSMLLFFYICFSISLICLFFSNISFSCCAFVSSIFAVFFLSFANSFSCWFWICFSFSWRFLLSFSVMSVSFGFYSNLNFSLSVRWMSS